MTSTKAWLITLPTTVLLIHFLLNNPGSWGNYEACLELKNGMSPSEVSDIMGNPDRTYTPDHGRFDQVYSYDRYWFASSGPILVKFESRGDDMVLVGRVCEDIW